MTDARPLGAGGVRPSSGISGLPAGTLTAAIALYALGYLFWERSGLGSPAVRDLVGTAAFMPLNLVLLALNALASRNQVLDAGVRRALQFLAAGAALVFIGNCISMGYLTSLGDNTSVSWADPFYLGDSILTVMALRSFPVSRRTRLEEWKFALDAATVLLGGGVAIWYFSVRPATQQSDLGAAAVLGLAFPLANLLILLGVTTVLLRGPLDGNRRAFRWLIAGTLLSIIADLAFALVQVQAGGRTAAWSDGVFMASYLMLIAGAELYWRRPVPARRGSAETKTRIQPLSPLPYVAVASTYGLLLFVAVRPWTDPVSGLAVGAVLITGLVVIRQVLTVQENVRLLRETAAVENEARFRSLVQHSSDVIMVVDSEATIRFVSPSASRVLRYDPERLPGLPLSNLLDADDRERARNFFQQSMAVPGVSAPVELRFRQPDGAPLLAEIIATNLLDDPSVRGIVLNTRDISERKRLEKQLTHQAFHDPLTGLANRALFRDRVSHALTLAYRQKRPISVLFMDLDDFKKVNDSLGHSEGDRLLVAAAERFRACARLADTVARLGGDEFAILIEDVNAGDSHAILVERLTEAMSRPFSLVGHEVHVNVSIGIATTTGEESADDLLRNADVAMYTAKRRGKGRSMAYEPHMYSDVRQRLEMEAALRTAIERQELKLYYQPILSLKSGMLYGVEALLRWDHPEYGHVLPHHFVPLAEETGLIVQLGEWVLREACQQVKRWRLAYPGTTLTVAVNISGRQLHEQDIVEETRTALADSGVDPDAVVLEITESVLMQQTGSVLERLRQLKALGIRLAIDDFGTGYSSLSYLQRFPIDILKIAKPFVDDVGMGVERSALARAIIGLGETLKLRTIAEGIEVTEQRMALIEIGCELGQGYCFAPPLPADSIDRWLREPRPLI